MRDHQEDLNGMDTTRFNAAIDFLDQIRVRDTVSDRLAHALMGGSVAKELAFLESDESGDLLARAQAATLFADEQFNRNSLDSVAMLLHKSLDESPDFYTTRSYVGDAICE